MPDILVLPETFSSDSINAYIDMTNLAHRVRGKINIIVELFLEAGRLVFLSQTLG